MTRTLHRLIPMLAALMPVTVFSVLLTSDTTSEAVQELDFQELEAIRHAYDIEQRHHFAKTQLARFLEKKTSSKAVAPAYFLMGRIYDHQGQTDSAADFYQRALKTPGLTGSQLPRLYRRLAKIKPELARPIVKEQGAISEIGRIFPMDSSGYREYAFEIISNKKIFTEFSKQFAKLDAQGRYSNLPIELEKNEELLNVGSNFYIASGPGYIRFGSSESHKFQRVSYKTPATGAAVLTSRSRDFLVFSPGRVDFFKNGSLSHSLSHKGKNCDWSSIEKRHNAGFLSCDDSLVYLWDEHREDRLTPVSSLAGRLFFITSCHDLSVFQYYDKFEVRGGVDFTRKLWEAPSHLSDKIHLTRTALYIKGANGTVRSYNPYSGQEKWQKEFYAKQILPAENEIYIATYYQAIIGVSPEGRTNWYYEYGWENETTAFLLNGYIALLFSNGQRIKLNLDLMRITYESTYQNLLQLVETPHGQHWRESGNYARKVLQREPGNGLAWHYLYLSGLAQSNLESKVPDNALINASRSMYTPPWTNTPVLQSLRAMLKSQWIWKRSYGQKYYPNLTAAHNNLLYVENNNQTLVILNARNGELQTSLHIPEELDSKVCFLSNDSIIISSPKKLYMVPVIRGGSGTKSFPLSKPVCEAQLMSNSLLISDWFGGLSKLRIPGGFNSGFDWSVSLSSSGLFLRRPKGQNYLDVIDIKGRYFAVSPEKGAVVFDVEMPKGTVTAVYSGKGLLYAGYDDGLVICLDKKKRSITWSFNLTNQIFSLCGNSKDVLVVTTSAKRLVCLNARNGLFLSETIINTPLISHPTVTDDGYWLGTTEPALEKRSFQHQLLKKYSLTDLPGNPLHFEHQVFVSTLDGFIMAFKN